MLCIVKSEMLSHFEQMRGSALSPAGWIAMAILVGLLAASIWYSVNAWMAISGVRLSGFGWFSLMLGVAVTIGLGVALMGLVFYSSRHGLDR